MSNIKNIVFDFGGTLDTDGIHWSRKFAEAYAACGIEVPEAEFRNAFVFSERNIPAIIKPDFSLRKTYETQIEYQLKYLIENGLLPSNGSDETAKKIADYCYNSTLENVEKTKSVLNVLQKEFVLGVVSNYYGNVATVLGDIGLAKYFAEIADSTVVGIRKPDSGIFEYIMNKLNAKPEATAVVGDSYKNDIAPSKKIGCKTVWIKGKGWDDDSRAGKDADAIVESISELPSAIRKL